MTMNAHGNVVETPVLVVGAGAGGLATSALLAKYGVGSLVVERRGEIFRYPKARNLSFRSLEILRALGVGDAVHAVAAASSDVVVMTTLNSPEQRTALDVDAIFAGLDWLSPEPSVQYCPQSRLEPILLERLRSRGRGIARNCRRSNKTPTESPRWCATGTPVRAPWSARSTWWPPMVCTAGSATPSA
jgi:2-polyprenyl-6-methoxyphenol hydroxylase-like FAD-dependent oxidoreductase